VPSGAVSTLPPIPGHYHDRVPKHGHVLPVVVDPTGLPPLSRSVTANTSALIHTNNLTSEQQHPNQSQSQPRSAAQRHQAQSVTELVDR
jgi:hypothetical protein